MKLTAQQEYGLRCLLVLAKAPEVTWTIPQIAEREALSRAYVAKLMRSLLKAGLVQSIRGHEGGYRLTRSPEEIPLNLVMNSLSGRLFSEAFCKDHAGEKRLCVHNSDCSLRALWMILDQSVQAVLKTLTLKSLLCGEAGLMAIQARESQKPLSLKR
jgi:Rrf2 family protein